MTERRVAWWDDVARDANSMFRVWSDGRELDWAKKSWEALSKRGLTAYSNQIEWTRVMVRLMALAAIYRDFCELAVDEIHEPEYTYWADDLSVTAFRVAQCVGSEFRKDEEVASGDLLESALLELMETARTEVHKVLLTEYGGESLLFVSLWNTVEYERAEDLEPEETDEDLENGQDEDDLKLPSQLAADINWRQNASSIVNNVTGEKMKAFEWIQQGMPALH